MTRVIHMRLSNQTIVRALDIMNKSGMDIDIPPLSSAIALFLDITTERALASGAIDDISEEDAEAIIDELIGESHEEIEEEETKVNPLDFLVASFAADDSKKEESQSDVVEKEILGSTTPIQPEIKKRSTIEHIDNEPPLLAVPPWEDPLISSFFDLEKMAPKDIMIETAVESNNEVLKRAIQCIYSNLPISQWGSEKAQQMITDIVPTIKRYVERDNVSEN